MLLCRQLFLTHLSEHLNASVSRRQQLGTLRSAFTKPEHASLDFRIFSNESADRVIVEWDLAGHDDEDCESLERLVVVQAAYRYPRDDLAADDLLARLVERKRELHGA